MYVDSTLYPGRFEWTLYVQRLHASASAAGTCAHGCFPVRGGGKGEGGALEPSVLGQFPRALPQHYAE